MILETPAFSTAAGLIKNGVASNFEAPEVKVEFPMGVVEIVVVVLCVAVAIGGVALLIIRKKQNRG